MHGRPTLAMPLTDIEIKKSKPASRPYKKFDGGGLHLFITPNGSKLWRLKYRFKGREKLLSYGPYPLVSLREARAWRDRAKRLLIDGLDPSAENFREKDEARAAAQRTFGTIAEEYIAKAEKEGRSKTTLNKKRWLLGHAGEGFNKKPVNHIAAPEVLTILRKIEAEGHYETARRVRSTIGGVFKYAIATGRASNDPTIALRDALIRPTVKSRAAITDWAKFGKLLRRIDRYTGHPGTRLALQLIALLACRPGELRHARWNEFDINARVWRIPADRMKMRRDHRVPLPEPALELLAELSRVSGETGFLFPSVRTVSKPISENTLNNALRRMGYSGDEVTAHGFRATFSTLANEAGKWNPDAIERALAHVEANEARRAYARGEHWDERLRLADWWAGKLEQCRLHNQPT